MFKIRSRILSHANRLLQLPNITAPESRKHKMTNATFAALAASAILVSAPAMAQENPPFVSPYAGTSASIDWTKLSTLKDRSTSDGGLVSYYGRPDDGPGLGLRDTFADSDYNASWLDASSDYGRSPKFVVEKSFGDGDSLLFREAGYAEAYMKPAAMADAVKNGRGWRFEGGFERSLNDTLSLRLSREYTAYGNDFDQWQTKAGLQAKF